MITYRAAKVLVLALTLTVRAASVCAQQPTNPSEVQAKAYSSLTAPPNLPLGTLPTTDLVSGRAAVAEILLEGTSSDGAATAAIGWKRGSAQYRVKLSSPIGSPTTETELLSIEDGLPTGANVEFTASNLMWANASEEDLIALEDICQAGTGKPTCDIGQLPVHLRPEARRLLRMDDTPLYFAVTVAATRRNFDFLDDALEEQSAGRTDASFALRIGAFSQTFGFGFLSYSYQERHSPGSPARDICRPRAGTDALICDEAVLGAPSRRLGSVLSGELRRYLATSIGIAPAIRYEFKSEVTTISLPVYFLRGTKTGLTGGVRASWRSDTRGVSFIVFAGTSFSLI